MSTSVVEPTTPSNAPVFPPQKVLPGQQAIMTGANSGIGPAVAVVMGEASADVVAN